MSTTGDLLVGAVNVVVDADVVIRQREWDSRIAGRQLTKAGHVGFDYKAATGRRCRAAFSKQATCSSCVVRFMIVLKTRYTREKSPSTKVTAMSPSTALMPAASGFDRSTVSMSADNSIPVTGTPRRPTGQQPGRCQ